MGARAGGSERGGPPRRARIAAGALLLGGAVALATRAAAAPLACDGPAGARRVVLAELYSTDACESCPPAEHLFNTMKAGPEVVPIVWHVDYFDTPEWKDRYALAISAQRQQALARAQELRVVATPQVFLDGVEFGAWRDDRALRSRIVRSAAGQPGGTLAIARVERIGAEVLVDVLGQGGAQLQAVLVQDGLATAPTGGENKGLQLAHEHVVRAATGPRAVPGSESWSARLALVAPADSASAAGFGVVAWTQDAQSRVSNATWARCPP
jgi:hypothetical protein